jgi:hypothetical protein
MHCKCNYPIYVVFSCGPGSTLERFDIHDTSRCDLSNIEILHVMGLNVRGPLKSIPSDVCNFRNLKVNISSLLNIYSMI